MSQWVSQWVSQSVSQYWTRRDEGMSTTTVRLFARSKAYHNYRSHPNPLVILLFDEIKFHNCELFLCDYAYILTHFLVWDLMTNPLPPPSRCQKCENSGKFWKKSGDPQGYRKDPPTPFRGSPDFFRIFTLLTTWGEGEGGGIRSDARKLLTFIKYA